MTARLGMAAPITRLRQLTNAGSADYTVAGVNYFTDDQMQAELDRTSSFLSRVRLFSVPTWQASIFVYYDYIMPEGMPDDFEHYASDGSSKFAIKDGAGTTINPNTYTVNYEAKRINFGTVDQQNKLLFLDVIVLDVNRAAAQIWRQKASFVSAQVDWSTTGNNIRASQESAAYIAQAEKYESLSGVKQSNLVRTDENPANGVSLTNTTGENRDALWRNSNDWKY